MSDLYSTSIASWSLIMLYPCCNSYRIKTIDFAARPPQHAPSLDTQGRTTVLCSLKYGNALTGWRDTDVEHVYRCASGEYCIHSMLSAYVATNWCSAASSS